MTKIVERLKPLREAAGFSQPALGAQLKLSHPQVSRIENGVTSTPIETVEAWLDVCGYDLVPVPREAPQAEALVAEMAIASESERAILLRLCRLLPRLDDQVVGILDDYVQTLERRQDKRDGIILRVVQRESES